jgi:transglutaminase-like putative cysteine protease
MNPFCSRSPAPLIRVLRVPKGTRGTFATVRLIGDLIRSGAKDFCVRQKAIDIFRRYRVRPKDRWNEVCSIFDWVRRNVRYTRDIFRVELLHSARRMIDLCAGDCDDMTILLGAMLLATGHPVRLVLAGFAPERPHVYTHIYPEVHVAGRWLAIDATMPHPIGWAPPARWKRICEINQEGMTCWSKTR